MCLPCELGCLAIRDCFPVGVKMPSDDDGEMDKPESDSEDEVEQVTGGGGGGRADRPKTYDMWLVQCARWPIFQLSTTPLVGHTPSWA